MKHLTLKKTFLILLLILFSVSMLHAEETQSEFSKGTRIKVIVGKYPPTIVKPEKSGYSKKLIIDAGKTGVVIGQKELSDRILIIVEWDEQAWQEFTDPGIEGYINKNKWYEAQTGKWIKWKNFTSTIHPDNLEVTLAASITPSEEDAFEEKKALFLEEASAKAQVKESESRGAVSNMERQYLECDDEWCKAEKLAVLEEALIDKHRSGEGFFIPSINAQPNWEYPAIVRFTIKSISDSQYELKLQSVKDIAHGTGVGYWGYSSIIRFEGKVRFPIRSEGQIGGGWLNRGTLEQTLKHGLTNSTLVRANPTEEALLFEGDPKDPLSFAFLHSEKLKWPPEIVFCYLHGTGKVYLKDGTIVSLPPKK